MAPLDCYSYADSRSARLSLFDDLLVRLERFLSSPDGGELFSDLITRSQLLFEMEDLEYARSLGVNRTTVGRWRNQRTVPLPLTQEAVLRAIQKVARSKRSSIEKSEALLAEAA